MVIQSYRHFPYFLNEHPELSKFTNLREPPFGTFFVLAHTAASPKVEYFESSRLTFLEGIGFRDVEAIQNLWMIILGGWGQGVQARGNDGGVYIVMTSIKQMRLFGKKVV